MQKQILHVDVNNAFLSWTAIDMLNKGYEIDIRTIPSVIGGDEERRAGIVLAKSMKAKEIGIVTGETLYSARKKCPNIKIFPSNRTIYKQYSDKMYKLLLEYTDIIERFSIDECFLDMTHYLMKDTLINKANEISKRIKQELGFTVNVGVAHNKLLAKMASDFTKPDRVHTLFKDEIQTKMWSLPISELFMTGKQTSQKLYNIGIKTIGDLAKADKNYIIKRLGKFGKVLWEYANGIDESEVKYKEEKPKGVGNSVTLPIDINNKEKIKEVLLTLSEQVAYRLRKYDLLANTVSVQLRTKDFKDYSHQKRLSFSTANTKEIYNKAIELLNEMYKNNDFIRLVGLRVENLVPKDEMQLSIFNDEKAKKQEKLDKTVDKLKDKYGYTTITRAGNLEAEEIFGMKYGDVP